MSTSKLTMILVVFLLVLAAGFVIFKMKSLVDATEVVSYTSIVVKKHQEIESINRMGATRTNYYVLYDDNTIDRIDVETFIRLNVGDTIRRTKRIYK